MMHLNDLLKKIYENVLLDEEYTLNLRKTIDNDVETRISKYQALMDSVEFENLKNDFFASCYVAEQIGFKMGVKFMKRL